MQCIAETRTCCLSGRLVVVSMATVTNIILTAGLGGSFGGHSTIRVGRLFRRTFDYIFGRFFRRVGYSTIGLSGSFDGHSTIWLGGSFDGHSTIGLGYSFDEHILLIGQ